MTITIVADVLGEENNGTTIACMNLARFLQNKGHTVKIVCSDKDKKGRENYYVVPTLYLGFIINYIVKKNNVALSLPKTKILKEAFKGSDIVHVMMPLMLGKKAVKVAKKMNIPVTAGFHVQAENFTSHLMMMNNELANNLTYRSYYKKVFSKVDAIHYPTQFIKDLFYSKTHCETKGYVISNGVNDIYKKDDSLRDNHAEDGYFNILFTGRISKEKSHRILVKAVSLSKYKDKIHLFFAGQGPREKSVKSLANKLKVNLTMNFYSREELLKIINNADLYVHPAEAEIEAISCLEAIKCGITPVIANSPKCATKAFALSENNLFKLNNPKSLAEKIDFWIEHPELRVKTSSEYLVFTEKFNQKHCMEEMESMLLETIEARNGKESLSLQR